MNYPIVYDKKETAFTGLGIAVLDAADNVKVREVINGEFKLSLILPRTDPKWQYILAENFIKVYDISQGKDQLFRIRGFSEERDNKGRLTSNIQAEHVYYDSITCKHLPKVELIGKTPEQILRETFSGTRFVIGVVEVTTQTDIILSRTNPSKVVQQLIDSVGGELIRDNWTIHLLNQRGSNKGVQFRFGKNIDSIKRETDGSLLCTRLYPYGKDYMQIDAVNGGKPYIDSPLIGNYDRPIIRDKDYKDISDPAKLLQAGLDEWSTNDKDGIDKPRVSYSGSFLELSKHKEYGELEKYGLGDIAKVIDSGIDANTNQRILEYEFYPYESKKSNLGLANYEVKAYRNNNIGSIINNANQASQVVDRITTSTGNINAAAVDNILTRLETEINQMVQSALVHCQADMYVDNLQNPMRALIFGNGIFAIANSKKANGDWDWRTIATGDKIIADEVNAKWVYAGKIVADQIESGTIRGIRIIGSTFEGGTINIQTDAYIGKKLFVETSTFNDGIYFSGFRDMGITVYDPSGIIYIWPSLIVGNGANGSFQSADGKSITVTGGIVTDIV